LAVGLALVLGLVFAAPALGDSVVTEQAQGAHVLSQIQHGTLNPKSLTDERYQNLGEYLMGRVLGSTQLHQRMNTLMDKMMGPTASDQMHIYLGKRYLGVSATPTTRYGQLYGLMGVMMSGDRGSALAGMMGAYLNGQGTAGYTMGPGMMGYAYPSASGTSSSGGWPTAAIVATAILAGLLLAAAVAFLTPRIRSGRRTVRPRHADGRH
jgi:hypothetical protein